jgi:hypothetical protein
MTRSLPPALEEIHAKLRIVLQQEPNAGKLEKLAAALLGRLLQVPIFVASSGFQHGGDAGPAGRQQRRFRIEAKKYADSTKLDSRQLLGEIDHALARDECLEAWILVATRTVPEQLAHDLLRKGEQVGVPVVILGWQENSAATLAALCAWAPDLVGAIHSAEAETLARQLVGLEAAVEELRRELQPWRLGFEGMRRSSIERLEKVWASPRASNACFGQNAAGGAVDRKIPRVRVRGALDSWWQERAAADAPAVVVGWDGVGKTWATLEWLVHRKDEQPIVLIVSSSAVASLSAISVSSLKSFLAEQLGDLAGVRNREHWQRRLDLLLKRPIQEGPVLTVFFDGLNQESSVDWLRILKTLQGEAFEGRVRVVLTTRQLHFEEKLGKLRGLVVPAVEVRVDPFDAAPRGELDQMLLLEGLLRDDLHADLVELARTPRLFGLVVKFREKLVDAGQVTVHRLLWEYGRDTAGVRAAGRSFSDQEWQEWLRTIANQYREGVRTWSAKMLEEITARPGLREREVFARLSDIVDGRFTIPGPAGRYQLTPTVTAHALGAALLATLDSADPAEVQGELSSWLDPIAGLDERADVLRAAVSILVEQGRSGEEIAGPLVTAWLQTQNVPDHHRREISALASDIARALLYAIEHSTASARESARNWAIQALRSVPRTNRSILSLLVAETRTWFTKVSRDVDRRDDAESSRRRAERFLSRIGVDSPGPVTVLGVRVELVEESDWVLTTSAPPLLEGFPLESAMPVFEAAAIELAVRGQCPAWPALKWLCLLNEKDPELTTRALVALSLDVRSRKPEPGVHPDLPARVGALLLWLTGREVDDDAADALDPGIEKTFRYETDYLPNPAESWLPLELRHAAGVLRASELGLRHRILRTKPFWLDPTFEIPAQFADEVRAWAASIDVSKLDEHMSYTVEDHNFEEFEPVLARCAPADLAELVRRKLRGGATCSDRARYFRAIRGTRHFVLAGADEAEAAHALRLRHGESDDREEAIVANELLILELSGKTAIDQIATVVEAGLETILVDLGRVVRTPAQEDVDELISRFEGGTDSQKHNLLCMLAVHRLALSDRAWSWIEERARIEQGVTRSHAFRLLAACNATRFARALLAWDWNWTESQHPFTNHHGSGALIEGAPSVRFEQLATRLAPWRLLEAARRRGGDPNEVRLAATILGRVMLDQRVEVPDLGACIRVDSAYRTSNPLTYSVEVPEENDPVRALQDFEDRDAHAKAYRRAVDIASTRIDDARRSGAHLYLADVGADDMELVLRFARELVDPWLQGAAEVSAEFRRKVMLAEGAYLGLCEALLRHEPERGEVLWRGLRSTLVMQHVGEASVDELLHVLFRAPASEPVERLRCEVSELPACATDHGLEDIAIAATIHGATGWLEQRVNSDKHSGSSWRQRRGVVLDGFRAGNVLPVAGAWVEGELRTNIAENARKAALNRTREASAHVWWREFLAAPDSVSAYAAWVLFLRSVDRRAWMWMEQDISTAPTTDAELLRRKLIHAELNLSTLRHAMEKSEDKRESQFLMRDTVDTIGPWRRDPA